ncbi:hypothetical protein JCM6882_006495 [Rhodosporidiobolus microsporus]
MSPRWTDEEEQALVDAVEGHPKFPHLAKKDFVAIGQQLYASNVNPTIKKPRVPDVHYFWLGWVEEKKLCPRCQSTHKYILASRGDFNDSPPGPNGSPEDSDVKAAAAEIQQGTPAALRKLSYKHAGAVVYPTRGAARNLEEEEEEEEEEVQEETEETGRQLRESAPEREDTKSAKREVKELSDDSEQDLPNQDSPDASSASSSKKAQARRGEGGSGGRVKQEE